MESNANSQAVNAKKQRIRNNVIFTVLCILIAILLLVDFITISNAYFTSSRNTENPSVITTGNVDFSYRVYNGAGTDITSSEPITLGTETLLPGNEIHYKLAITNSGNVNCYIRMKCSLEIEIDDAYVEVDILRVKTRSVENQYDKSFDINVDSSNVHSNTIVYYKNADPSDTHNGVIPVNSTVEIPIKFVLDEATEEFNAYANRRYRVYLTIESIQAPGVTLSNSLGWVVSGTNPAQVISFD